MITQNLDKMKSMKLKFILILKLKKKKKKKKKWVKNVADILLL